ncbi:MAG: signal peptidase II [Clostridium sp.]|uniref:signal peptidase II n=1 Tax=Clostridium sp. TaxID=1506 RepID=UPI002FCB566C
MFNALMIFILVLLDQGSKYLANVTLKGQSDIVLVKGLFSLTYLENRGAAFGMFQNNKFILVGLTSLVIIGLIIFLYKEKRLTKTLKISIILIIGGAIGNLIDRVFLGYVIDYFHFYITDIFDWPVFNIADICVVIGTGLMAISILFAKDE